MSKEAIREEVRKIALTLARKTSSEEFDLEFAIRQAQQLLALFLAELKDAEAKV